MKIKAPL